MSLPATLSSLSFLDGSRARTNLELLTARLPESLLSQLPTTLAQVPDPDGALNTLERFTRHPGLAVMNALVGQPALLHYLLALFSHSQFLGEMLVQQPELIIWVGRERNLDRIKSKEELLEEYARFEATLLEVEPGLGLARFKRRQYLRITLRDILGLATLVETTLELSILADVLLQKALAGAEKSLRERYGRPQSEDARGRRVAARFAVVSLGKLGGQELNYNSDVDLLFLYQGEGNTDSRQQGRRIANKEIFIRVAQGLLERVAGVTREGPVFRVDLRLRPGGGEGDLVLSLSAALRYYKERAREWELQMLLKARHSAGDAGLVQEFLSSVEPFVFRGPMHFAAVESVVSAREQIGRKLDAAGVGRLNVKLAAGGIRDIEFLVQCLQRLYGRQDPWVRAGGSLVALHKLYDKGYLSARDHFHLAAAYEFLRRAEHRLQLEKGQQTHTLPTDPAALNLLARRCGVEGSQGRPAGQEFRRELERHLRRVQAIAERILPSAPSLEVPEETALKAPEAMVGGGELTYAQLRERLQTQRSRMSAELLRLSVPVQAEKYLRRFLASAMSSSATYEEVEGAAAAIPQGLDVLRLSEPLGALLIRRPERLSLVLEARARIESRAGDLLPLDQDKRPNWDLPPSLGYLLAEPRPLAEQMAILRRIYWDSVFGWGARQVCGRDPVDRGLDDYTRLVESTLRAGLAVAEQQSHKSSAAAWAAIALGRLGTMEMDLGSDADVVFVAADSAGQTALRPVAEKFIHVLSAYTREGTILPLDVRLRPHGGEGELVQTMAALLDYFANAAEVWEAATYLKARPVAGDSQLGEEFCRSLQEVLRGRFSDWSAVKPALAEMRGRLEEESAKSLDYKDNFKTGPGGLYDLDFLCAGLGLREGISLTGRTLIDRWEWLLSCKEFSRPEGEELRNAARLLMTTDHAVRLATGQGSARLPGGQRGENAAELAGRWLGEELTPVRLAARLGNVRELVRRFFVEVFG